jgi:hypothetical protein
MVNGKISGTSPMHLAKNCVRCGKDAAQGRRISATQYFSPRWVWLGLLAGVLPVVVLYFVGRKTLHISYSLCPECAREERRKKWIAAGAWLLVAVSALASVGLGDAWILIACGILLVAAVVASFQANAPVIVSGYKDQVFTVKGVSEEFLAFRETSTV